MPTGVVLAVHGGAGVLRREDLTPEKDRACRDALAAALASGWAVWRDGGAALDIAAAAVRSLEDCPLFNAGRGAVLTSEGTVEMDAAVMRGSDRAAGAVAGVTAARNPIDAARAVLERTPFVFLAGPGADALVDELQLPTATIDYFLTPERQQQLAVLKARGVVSLSEDNKHGTVGAVARDRSGSVAAATSTGGMTNKRPGRVGDSPVIGAGTWADDATCAISATGHGEFFLRAAAAHDIAARIAYAGQTLDAAADAVVRGTLRAMGGDGGIIAIDRHGAATLPMNCAGMYRGVAFEDGSVRTAIYADEGL